MSAASALPKYRPIEEIFPYWITARAIITPLLPTYFTASLHPVYLPARNEREAVQQEFQKREDLRSGRINLNTDWAQRMVDLTPVEDIQALMDLFGTISAVFIAEFDTVPDLLAQLLGHPVDPIMLHHIKTISVRLDEERKRAGKLTFAELVAHVMGIQPCLGFSKLQVRSVIGGGTLR